MPLVRRIPKFGFTNPFRVDYTVINLKTLAHLEDVALHFFTRTRWNRMLKVPAQ